MLKKIIATNMGVLSLGHAVATAIGLTKARQLSVVYDIK